MRLVWVVCAFLGCGGGETRPGPTQPTGPDRVGEFAADDWYAPTYGTAELQRALIAERGAEATSERILGELELKDREPANDDRVRVARADLEVRRRFIASLEACETSRRACPPRLDDPPWAFDPDPDAQAAPKLETALRYDLVSWQKVTAELHGRACACRTIACVDSMAVAIDQLETRPMPDVQGDEAASVSITRARECLFRLRGKRATPGGPLPVEE